MSDRPDGRPPPGDRAAAAPEKVPPNAPHSGTGDAPGNGAEIDAGRRQLVTWLWRLPVLATLGGGAYGAYRGWQVHFVKPPPGEPAFVAGPAVPVAPLDAFAAPWDSHSFHYRDTPAVALRLPQPVAGGVSSGDLHLGAFSRVCTHLGCLLNYTRNPEAIDVAANHRTDHPALVCGCHLSVFEPLEAGRAVAGPAQRPLPRVALEVRDGTLYAVGMEPPPPP